MPIRYLLYLSKWQTGGEHCSMELDLDDVWDNEIMTKFDTHWDYKHNEPK
jgi:hypothetical protein